MSQKVATNPVTKIVVVMFTDIVDSVALKSRLGASDYSELIARHDRLFMDILKETSDAELRQDTGDGFYALFPTPTSAVIAALKFQHAIYMEHWPKERLSARIGLHMGEISVLQTSGERESKLVGLPIDLTARIMGLASGGQILMSRAVFDDARQYLRRYPVSDGDSLELKWVAHGPYVLKGQENPLDIFEVGSRGIAPLRPPADSKKAKRVVSEEDVDLLGWRPAANLAVPHHPDWILKQKLGEGGIGEVWAAKHRDLDEDHVFKFCFDAEKLRILKHEIDFFQLFRKTLGLRRDISQLHNVQLDRPPFFLESDFTKQGDLISWAERKGGIDKVPIETRLNLFAQCADAVAAAHSVGVLHKDIKHINILIDLDAKGEPFIKLAGFGIAELTEQDSGTDETPADSSEPLGNFDTSFYTSTRFHIPPETLAGQAYTVQSDVYALGVLLYQLAVGDLGKPLAPGWERDIDDEILRGDIQQSVDGDPERRLPSARELAERIHNLEQRRELLLSQRKNEQIQDKWKRSKLIFASSVAILLILVGGMTTAYMREQELRLEAEKAQKESKLLAAKSEAISRYLQEMLSAFSPKNAQVREFTVSDILQEAMKNLDRDDNDLLRNQPLIEADIRLTIANTFEALGQYEQALPNIERVVSMRKSVLGDQHADTIEAVVKAADLYQRLGRYSDAEPLFLKAVEIQRVALGPEHEDTLSTLNGLAALYTSRGQFEEADSIYRHVIEKRRTTLGSDHSDTLESMIDLAMLRREQGRFEEAKALYLEVLDKRRGVLGDKHPDILRYMENLAGLYQDQGRYEEAEPIIVEVYEKQREILGEDHPDTLHTMNTLAAIYYQEGDYDQAELLFLRGVDRQRANLGDDHQDTLSAINNLAALYWKQGRLDKAEPLFVLVLGSQQKVLGSDHPDTLITINNLGVLYSRQGHYEVAERFLTQAIDGRQKILGMEHPGTLNSKTNLAELYTNTGRYEESEQLASLTFVKQQELLGEKHPQTRKTLKLLADLQAISEKYTKGIDYQALLQASTEK